MTQDEKKKVKELIKLELEKANLNQYEFDTSQEHPEYSIVCSKAYVIKKELGL